MSVPEVLVVGAGPTGLTAAIELARRGVAVRVIDKVEPRPYAESRAEGVHARTLEVFERQGVLPQVLARGRVLAGFAFLARGRPLGELSAGGLDSPHAYSVLLPQSEVEDILLEHLRGLGVEVERPVELTGLTLSAQHVHVQLRHADGTTSSPVVRYLVAADGGHSTVRGALGIAFDGTRMQGAYVMDAEAEFTRALPEDRGTFLLARGGFLVVGRRPDGSHRIALSLPATTSGSLASVRPGPSCSCSWTTSPSSASTSARSAGPRRSSSPRGRSPDCAMATSSSPATPPTPTHRSAARA